MAKKNFNNVSAVYSALQDATSEEQIPGQTELNLDGTIAEPDAEQEETPVKKGRKTYTAEEALEALENLHTSGRKGVHAPRINMAFTPENFAFVKIMASIKGQSITEFVNEMLDEARTKYADKYNKAVEFKKSIDL